MSNDASYPVLQPLGEGNVIQVGQSTRFLTALRFDQMPISVELLRNNRTLATWVPHVYCEDRPQEWKICDVPLLPGNANVWSVAVVPETVQVFAETAHQPGAPPCVRSLEPVDQDGTHYHGIVIDLVAEQDVDMFNTTVTVETQAGGLVLDRIPLAVLERCSGYNKDTVCWIASSPQDSVMEGPLKVTFSPVLEDYDVYGLTFKNLFLSRV